MPDYTTNYLLAYFTGSDNYASDLEYQRWVTVDGNLGALAKILGNGVLDGWTVSATVGGTAASIDIGKGFIYNLASESDSSEDVTVTSFSAETLKVLAQITADTYYTKDVTFSIISGLLPTPSDSILLANIVTDAGGLIESVDNSVKQRIGITNDFLIALQNHVHTGDTGNPTKIDLGTQVQGILSSDHIGAIPASKIIGSIPADRLSSLSHEDLLDIGVNTHLQLDDFVETIDDPTFQQIGLISAINVMQAFLVQAHWIGSEVFRYQANTRPIIAGITPDTYMDTYNSTATIDTVNHMIYGTHGTEISPPQDVTTVIDQISGEFGFSGPKQVAKQNVIIGDVGDGTPYVELDKLSSIDYYYDEGYFFVDLNAGASADWQTAEWTSIAYSGSLTFGTLGTLGADLQVYGQSALRRENLPQDTATGNWVYLADYSNSSAALSGVDNNKWLRLMFKFMSNTGDTGGRENRLTPLLQDLTITYDTGADPQCAFILLREKEDWEEYEYSNSFIEILEGTEGLILYKGQQYSSSAVYESPVLYSPNLISWGSIFSAFMIPSGITMDIYVRASDTAFEASDSTLAWTYKGSLADRISLSTIDEKYLQIRITIAKTSSLVSTPEILAIGVSLFDEEISSRNTQIHSYQRDAAGLTTLGTKTLHNMAPGQYILVTGSNAFLSPTFDGVYKLLEESYGYTLVMGGTIVEQSFTLPDTGPIVTPCIERYKTWNKGGSVEDSWFEVKETGETFEVYTANNIDNTSYAGAITINTNGPALASWISAPFNPNDPSFQRWHKVEVHGENLFNVNVYMEFSKAPKEGVWSGDGIGYTALNGNSPISVDFASMNYNTYPWARVKVIMTK